MARKPKARCNHLPFIIGLAFVSTLFLAVYMELRQATAELQTYKARATAGLTSS